MKTIILKKNELWNCRYNDIIQIRRPMDPQPPVDTQAIDVETRGDKYVAIPYTRGPRQIWQELRPRVECPFAPPQEEMAVLEEWQVVQVHNFGIEIYYPLGNDYVLVEGLGTKILNRYDNERYSSKRRVPSSMPLWASRTKLKVLKVWTERADRYQPDAPEKEGFRDDRESFPGKVTAREKFEVYWHKTWGRRFQMNNAPEVFVGEFQVIRDVRG